MVRKIDITEVKRRIKEKFPDEEFEIVNYESLGMPGDVRCCNCNKIIHINKFSNFLAPSKRVGCSSCQSEYVIRRKKDMEKILENYDIVGEYIKDTHKNYHFKCKHCGHIRSTTLRNLIKNYGCGCTTGVKRKRTADEFLQEVNSNSIDGTYELIGDYVDQTTKVLLRHSCGFIWYVRPGDVIHGRSRCPKCGKKRSKGELLIESILTKNNIDFQAEKRLDNSLQRFDFYFENDKHKIAIEFNGAQHYQETDVFQGDLATYQQRDFKKAQYCEENNIELYVIPYTKTNNEIEEIILDILNKFND